MSKLYMYTYNYENVVYARMEHGTTRVDFRYLLLLVLLVCVGYYVRAIRQPI